MKIQELVYNRPQFVQSGRVHFNLWLYVQFHIFFLSLKSLKREECVVWLSFLSRQLELNRGVTARLSEDL